MCIPKAETRCGQTNVRLFTVVQADQSITTASLLRFIIFKMKRFFVDMEVGDAELGGRSPDFHFLSSLHLVMKL